jgi:hypothetical protein
MLPIAQPRSLHLERDDFSSNRHPALACCWSMIFSEKPVPAFRDHALKPPSPERGLASKLLRPKRGRVSRNAPGPTTADRPRIRVSCGITKRPRGSIVGLLLDNSTKKSQTLNWLSSGRCVRTHAVVQRVTGADGRRPDSGGHDRSYVGHATIADRRLRYWECPNRTHLHPASTWPAITGGFFSRVGLMNSVN